MTNPTTHDLARIVENEAIFNAIYTENGLALAMASPDHAIDKLDAIASLPEGFISVADRLPSHDRAVIAIRLSGYVFAKFEVITARYMRAYRPHSPWRRIDMDSVTDDGDLVLGWREAPEWLQHSK